MKPKKVTWIATVKYHGIDQQTNFTLVVKSKRSVGAMKKARKAVVERVGTEYADACRISVKIYGITVAG